MNNLSEVARFKRQTLQEQEAARQGLSGLASVASHESICARMKESAEHILDLIRSGRHAEAQALLDSETWGAGD